MQPVHTCWRFGVPLTSTRIRWMLGFQRRLVRTCEWLTLMPNDGRFPHTSHTAAMARTSNDEGLWGRASTLASPPMETLERLGAPDLKAVVLGYRDALRAHQEAVNRLNVYPVPDGDTGTNMALTLESVVAEMAGATCM